MTPATVSNTASTTTASTSAKGDQKKQRLLIIGGVAVLTLLYFTYEFIFYVETDNAQIQANTVILTSRVTGYVSKVVAEEGQKVKAGDVLVEIDAKDYKSRTHQSENELASQMARLHDAQLNYDRIQKLYTAGAVSTQQRDSAYAVFQELARKQKALEAQVELSQSGLTDTLLRAPSDGTIAKRSAEPGMLANPGTPLIGFVSDDSRWVIANFKETDLKKLKVGQKVEVSVDAIAGKSFEGEIERFYPSTGAIFSLLPPDNATGNFTKVVQRVPTRIKLLNAKKEDFEALRAGLSAVVTVHVH